MRQPSTIRRIWLTISQCKAPGRVGLGLSLLPPQNMTDCMAVLLTRGDLPPGWPIDIEVVSDPSVDPTLRGLPGTKGDVGDTGLSAYQLARQNGYGGTLTQWLTTLVGAPGNNGIPGAAGASAYDIARAAGFTGTQAQWLASLKGSDALAGATNLGTVDLARTGGAVITLGERDFDVSVSGLKKNDTLVVTPQVTTANPNALPTGWAFRGAIAVADGTLRLRMTTPLIAIGAAYSMTFKVTRINAT